MADKNENQKEIKPYKPTLFARDLLFLEIVKNTNKRTPKNSTEIIKELEKKWKEIFPNEQLKVCSVSTVARHIKDMNESGLYHIGSFIRETREGNDSKLGYYNEEEQTLFSSEEATLIAMALYRSPSISSNETAKILKKFNNIIGEDGILYNYFLRQQIKEWQGVRRKTTREILPIIKKLCDAILNEKGARKVKFNYYKNIANDKSKMVLQRDKRGRIIEYTVSPYFLVWESDECYLIAHDPKKDLPGEKHQLSHFKISLIENLEIQPQSVSAIKQIDNFERYIMETQDIYTLDRTNMGDRIFRTLKNRSGKDYSKDDVLIQEFSLDRYMREHIYMSSSNLPLVDVKIYFKEEFMESILTRFYVKKETLQINPTGELWRGEKVFRATITVQENDGLYQWLMQHSDKVIPYSPKHILKKLKQRHLAALETLKYVES